MAHDSMPLEKTFKLMLDVADVQPESEEERQRLRGYYLAGADAMLRLVETVNASESMSYEDKIEYVRDVGMYLRVEVAEFLETTSPKGSQDSKTAGRE